MKKILSIVVLLSMFVVANAQGNLEFNRVFLVEQSFVVPTNVSSPFSEQTITVPAGKVWKIESVMANYSFNVGSNLGVGSTVAVLLNRKTLYQAGVMAEFPIWLPEGTYTLRYVYTSNTGSVGSEIYGGISGIEFNVTL